MMASWQVDRLTILPVQFKLMQKQGESSKNSLDQERFQMKRKDDEILQ